MNAGSIVIVRRTQIGIRRRTKPCITTWPDSVPIAELASPDASSARAKIALAALPSSGTSVLCATSSDSTWWRPLL